MSWIVDRLQNLTGTVDDQAKADLDVDCDQPAMLRDLEQIARVISLRLGQACPSPQACSSQTSDVRYVVPQPADVGTTPTRLAERGRRDMVAALCAGGWSAAGAARRPACGSAGGVRRMIRLVG